MVKENIKVVHIEMAKNIGMGRAVDITNMTDDRLDTLIGVACPECGGEEDHHKGCGYLSMPTDDGWGDASDSEYI